MATKKTRKAKTSPVSPAAFAKLSPADRRKVARRLVAGLRIAGFFGRGKYNPVTTEVTLRERLRPKRAAKRRRSRSENATGLLPLCATSTETATT